MENEKKRRIKKWIIVALCTWIVLSVTTRFHNYRKVIFAYQSLIEKGLDSPEDIEIINKYVGPAHVPFDYMPVRPRYIHFWDEYNHFTYNNPVNN